MMPAPSPLRAVLQQAVAEGIFPGAVLAIRYGGERPCLVAAGRLSSDPPGNETTSSTVYDLASLTKPLATVTSLALLVQQGQCRLDDRVNTWLAELEDAPVGRATLRQLLTHSSGLPGWRGFYERLSPDASLPSSPQGRVDAKRQVLQLIKQEVLIYATGERSLYSDLGFMLLGILIERLSGMSLDQFVCNNIFLPLKAAPLCYLPTDHTGMAQKASVSNAMAPTEYDSWRGRLLWGEVHDENAAALGGVAGHAGLFGTAEAVLDVTGAWLGGYHHRLSILNSEVAREFSRRQSPLVGAGWALGWDTPCSPSSAGQHFSAQSFGHLGFTGTSIWVDPLCELEVVLLTNRVHPTRKNEGIRAFRPVIHDLVYQEYVKGS